MRHEDDEIHEVDLTRSLGPVFQQPSRPTTPILPFSNEEIHSEALEAGLMQAE